jgi:hypothetical protein
MRDEVKNQSLVEKNPEEREEEKENCQEEENCQENINLN